MHKYPCKCQDMKWMVDHNTVFKHSDGRWMLTWVEFDKEKQKGINIDRFGVVVHYCMFCGNKIKNLEE